ncbi:MAG: hypothetical protein ISS19_19440 [Bacteroidales bacterium]|nr:hypothetical protein [Bacteroidales bacterium]
MKSTWLILSLILLILFPINLFCQIRVNITKPRLELSDENLIIEYDILSADPSDLFKVRIEVTNASGIKINALSISGDVGEDISGGINLRILWNLEKDEISLDKEIFVEVVAEKKKLPEVQKEIIPVETTPTTVVKKISKGNMVLSSTVFPGWGLSKAKQGKPCWLLGVAGYGCIAGSVILNRTAIMTHDDYKVSLDADESITLYDKSVMQDNISEYLGYTAAGIWAVSLIWTIATSTASQELSDIQKFNNISIQPGYNQKMNCTMVSISYKF